MNTNHLASRIGRLVRRKVTARTQPLRALASAVAGRDHSMAKVAVRIKGFHPPQVALIATVLALLVPATSLAYTFPVEHQGGPRATATFVEDHGGWHAGIDLPRSDGATAVRAASQETVFHVVTLARDEVQIQNDATISAVTGPWSFELTDSRQKYMLDILRVRRVTLGKPERTYQVSRVLEVQPGIALDGVELVPNFPATEDSLVSGDSLAVDFAYYSSRIFQTTHRTDAGEYHTYGHVDSLHKYVDWTSYPATAENRYYGTDTTVPLGRWPHVVNEGEIFADIETINDFASEPYHLHFTIASQFMFPVSTFNPLAIGGFPTNDPQDLRPYVRSLVLLYGRNEYTFPDSELYGRVNILIESRDDMGSPEAADDGDGAENAIREAGCYNAAYWVTAEGGVGADIGASTDPNTMFAGDGKNTITGNDPLSAVLIRSAPYFVDVNTNYHLVASHVEEDTTRYWNTRARDGGARNDGSDAPLARVNSEARFGDGRYTLHAAARDVEFYGAVRESLVIVDNFRPYVRKVVVRDDSGELYAGEWTFDGTNIVYSHADPDDGMKDDFGNKRCADGTSDVTIEVAFSEPMKDAQMSAIDPLAYMPTLERVTPGQDTLWMAVVPKAKLKTTRDRGGRQILEIFGTDYADNDVRQITTPDPIDPADNSRDGAVMRGPGGADELHRFAICEGLALVVDVTGSMYDEIEAVKEAMTEAITIYRDDPDRFHLYSIVTFEDEAIVRVSTKDANLATAVLQSLYAGFGAACPEASIAALDSLPPYMPAGGDAILATDADPMEGRPRLDAAKTRLREKGIEVSALISGSCESFFAPSGSNQEDFAAATRGNGDAPSAASRAESGGGESEPTLSELFGTIDARIAFREVAEATGGLYFESFPNTDFVEAARIIARRLDNGTSLVNRSMTFEAPGSSDYPIPVDGSCSRLLVTLNYGFGDDTAFQLRRPSGAVVLPNEEGVEVHFAAGLVAYYITNPDEGEWTAEVDFNGGFGQYRLAAVARSPKRLVLGGAPGLRAGVPGAISVTVEGADTPTEFRLIRMDGTLAQNLTLFDDGVHGDGDAGDQTWASTITVADPGSYRVAMDGMDGANAFSLETARTIVVGYPDVAVADTLAFGSAALGETTTRVFYVRNEGVAPLIVDELASESAEFSVSPAAFTVRAGDAQRVEVTWTPMEIGATDAPASVASDDPDEPVYALLFSGQAEEPALLEHEPDTLVVSIAQGDSTEVALLLENMGVGPSAIALTNPEGASGPRSSRYRYRTSFAGDGAVPFRWETLGPEATNVGPLLADGAAGPFPLGFDLPFYGFTATEFYISENGYLTFNAVPNLDVPFLDPCPPASYTPYVAAYRENLDLRLSGRIRWQLDSEKLVVEYQDARRFDLNELETPLNCQIVVHRDGSIDFNYETVPPEGRALVGIGFAPSDTPVAPSCEVLYPARERTTIHFWRENPWLEISAPADTLDAGESAMVAVRLNTTRTGFDVGTTYETSIRVLNDAPNAQQLDIPVQLQILPGPYSISGRVTALEDGSGVAGTVVSATGPYGSYTNVTNANGDYTLTGLPAGGYEVTALSALFLPASPESLYVPEESTQDFALTRPIISLDPANLDFTLSPGDSVCLPVVVHNTGTAVLVLDGLRRSEVSSGFTEADYERVLDDPMFDTTGPDLVALDVARSSSEVSFRLTFSDTLSVAPPWAYISLDTDRNPGTGANPPAQGYGLPTQEIGAEYEIVFDNYCSNFVTLIDAVTGEYRGGYYLQATEKAITFTVPLTDLGNDEGSMDACVTSLTGYCDGGSRRPDEAPPAWAGVGHVDARSIVIDSGSSMQTSGIAIDWMPEIGHGTIGSCAWLSVTPVEAIVAPGDSVTLAVCVDASALADTSLGCSVSLESNDPRNPLSVLTVDLTVTSPTSTPNPGAPEPLAFALRQNDPNPFHEATRIRFSLPREERVRLSLFDASGRLVQQLIDGPRPAGQHEITLDSGRLPGGIYLYRLEAGDRVSSKKMIVLN